VVADDLMQEGLLGVAGSVREGRARVRIRHARTVKGQETARSMPHAARLTSLVRMGGHVPVNAEPYAGHVRPQLQLQTSSTEMRTAVPHPPGTQAASLRPLVVSLIYTTRNLRLAAVSGHAGEVYSENASDNPGLDQAYH